jgi:hypothetical protein
MKRISLKESKVTVIKQVLVLFLIIGSLFVPIDDLIYICIIKVGSLFVVIFFIWKLIYSDILGKTYIEFNEMDLVWNTVTFRTKIQYTDIYKIYGNYETGKLVVEFNKKNAKYRNGIQKMVSSNRIILSKISINFEELFKEFETISK